MNNTQKVDDVLSENSASSASKNERYDRNGDESTIR